MPQLRLIGDPKGKSCIFVQCTGSILQNIHIKGEINMKMKIYGKKLLTKKDLVLRNLILANPE